MAPRPVAATPMTVPIVSTPRIAKPASSTTASATGWCLERGCAWRMGPRLRRGEGLVSTRPATCGDCERQGPTDRGRHPTTATVRRPRASHRQAGARPHDERPARRRRPPRIRVRPAPDTQAAAPPGLRANQGRVGHMDGSSRTDSRDTFRPDIEGLRGVAILLVVLYHSSLVVGIPGGFIGVDVFFVISGFLITGLLLRERERSGGSPSPPSTPGESAACYRLAWSPSPAPSWRRSSCSHRWTGPPSPWMPRRPPCSVGNIRFALAEGDYFAAVTTPSPLLHYWSLAVEEQFYLVWPALVLVGEPGAPRPPRCRDRPCHRPRRIAGREPRGHGDRT